MSSETGLAVVAQDIKRLLLTETLIFSYFSMQHVIVVIGFTSANTTVQSDLDLAIAYS